MSHETKNLYHVQDADRPMYVIAPDWETAIRAWKAVIIAENDGEEGGEPDGISLIAPGADIVEWFREAVLCGGTKILKTDGYGNADPDGKKGFGRVCPGCPDCEAKP